MVFSGKLLPEMTQLEMMIDLAEVTMPLAFQCHLKSTLLVGIYTLVCLLFFFNFIFIQSMVLPVYH